MWPRGLQLCGGSCGGGLRVPGCRSSGIPRLLWEFSVCRNPWQQFDFLSFLRRGDLSFCVWKCSHESLRCNLDLMWSQQQWNRKPCREDQQSVHTEQTLLLRQAGFLLSVSFGSKKPKILPQGPLEPVQRPLASSEELREPSYIFLELPQGPFESSLGLLEA